MEGDETIPDAIMDDIWITRNYDISVSEELNILAIEMGILMKDKFLFLDKEKCFESLSEKKDSLQKKYPKNDLRWLDSINQFDESWNALARHGATFTARINSESGLFTSYFAVIQVSNRKFLQEARP